MSIVITGVQKQPFFWGGRGEWKKSSIYIKYFNLKDWSEIIKGVVGETILTLWGWGGRIKDILISEKVGGINVINFPKHLPIMQHS